LYGVWYPHEHSEQAFARALMNEVRGTAYAMRAIRDVIPGALLVQTDDLGRTYSTRQLAYQADFENTRRWITWDLLCGYVRDGRHRMWGHLQWAGIPVEELTELADAPCPPDIIGVNHYLTSERFLDERCELYPEHVCGGNGRDRYADIEAVRVLADGLRGGIGGLLKEAWDRYHIPIAVTEVHLGVNDEAEQMRWFADIWQSVRNVRETWDADIRAVTAWSVLGAYDWNSLMTRRDRIYERGVWDFEQRNPDGSPRATELEGLVRALAKSSETPPLEALAAPGWWQCDLRFLYPQVEAHELAGGSTRIRPSWKPAKFAIARHETEGRELATSAGR
jgi:dTDP-4-dehydrorhamnose reductase